MLAPAPAAQGLTEVTHGLLCRGVHVHHVVNTAAGITRSCSVSVVPALSLKLVARRHVDYGRTRSMICMTD
jgi:hypothetical protein